MYSKVRSFAKKHLITIWPSAQTDFPFATRNLLRCSGAVSILSLSADNTSIAMMLSSEPESGREMMVEPWMIMGRSTPGTDRERAISSRSLSLYWGKASSPALDATSG